MNHIHYIDCDANIYWHNHTHTSFIKLSTSDDSLLEAMTAHGLSLSLSLSITHTSLGLVIFQVRSLSLTTGIIAECGPRVSRVSRSVHVSRFVTCDLYLYYCWFVNMRMNTSSHFAHFGSHSLGIPSILLRLCGKTQPYYLWLHYAILEQLDYLCNLTVMFKYSKFINYLRVEC